ncbi:hypothetical protein [Chryseobacterium fistulae]|uniref:Secretion system C-terminal sorting domain-containing protein n=1 Tax=Chryseobacterium fistulae TaxID=2675058 RepID=A0A6N4XTA9_9FLAO|nr:hypothetical protein [Chryseobacterium fistulae]CAA7389972.1 hypothetical protein CHRY9393_02268 [Chryseobacterium fistulae]
MKIKLLSILSLFISFLGFSQTEVYFKYDEAGNQKYRGTNALAKKSDEAEKSKIQSENTEKIIASQQQLIDEQTFWKQIRSYPVPVNDVLTIEWNEDVNGLIESVSLYQHSTTHWKFQEQNIPSLNKQLKINMSGYEWGVYILRFTLKDGRVFSRNITKR